MPSIDRLPALPKFPTALPDVQQKTPAAQNGSFGETLKSFVSGVNEMQNVSAEKTLQFATGQITDVHEVMAASEEAGISLSLLIEIRNKLLEGYKELSHISV
ncbi:MAG TPA: flagellar hook-basal body complex protein FliE [bacterium]|jgi:flagellar hook-basal body complex protein FliE